MILRVVPAVMSEGSQPEWLRVSEREVSERRESKAAAPRFLVSERHATGPTSPATEEIRRQIEAATGRQDAGTTRAH